MGRRGRRGAHSECYTWAVRRGEARPADGDKSSGACWWQRGHLQTEREEIRAQRAAAGTRLWVVYTEKQNLGNTVGAGRSSPK